MIKRTLYFENPAYIHTKDNQLVFNAGDGVERSIPIEDIGFIIIDNEQISLSKTVISKLTENNAALIITNKKHMPSGMMMPLDANTLQQERFTAQISAPLPLKKRLWKQTVQAKIRNQAALIRKSGNDTATLKALIPKVQAGDPGNVEATAARRYWKQLFPDIDFKRGRYENPPNNLLNYGYAIMRALIARALTGAGLLPLVGINHQNRYNAYPLADDMMEPYRPFVDEIVLEFVKENNYKELGKEAKRAFLELPHKSVRMNKEKTPMMLAAAGTAVSLYKCFEKTNKTIDFPEPWN